MEYNRLIFFLVLLEKEIYSGCRYRGAYARLAGGAREIGRLRAPVGSQLVQIRYRAGGRRVAIALRNAAPM